MIKNHSKKIVVTGGAGFIGSSIVKHLNDQGFTNIVIVDNLGKTEKWKNLVGKRYSDILHKDQLFDWLMGRESDIQAFIHLGACSSTVETDANYLLENNYRYSAQLAEYALINQQRFIYASSAATYGDGSLGFDDNEADLIKHHPLNMYGYSKHMFDLWLQNMGLLDKVVGLKYFNVFGPNEYHKGRMSSAITHILPLARKEGKVRLFRSCEKDKYGDGEQSRDFIYVKDAARMTCAFLNNDAGGIYNIGTGKAETWNTLARSVFKAIDIPGEIEYIDMPADLHGKYQNYTQAEMKKTKDVLGKESDCMKFEDAVVEYVRNYLLPEKRW
ncbi:MAG: ADP-glyceromanno-heptose 6-epimerase [Parachlamydiales bacterium]|jgi:ADP-L-glycero-D-manno-heptose 6-epimerase